MVRLSVMYSATPGSRFDWDYYLNQHAELASRLLIPRGLLRTEIDKGIGGFPPGTPPTYHAVAHLLFSTLDEIQSALEATGAELMADIPNYTDAATVLQISEVVE